MVFLCVDIGGTNTLIGVGEEEFSQIEKLNTEKFLKNVGNEVEKVLNFADSTRNEVEKVAVAAAGPIDTDKNIFYPPNIPEVESIDLDDLLGFAKELKIVNDCAAAALGEYHYGDHGSDNMVYLTISSGIGAGVMINGELVEGVDGNFGEVGHMRVGDKLECGCGGKGHWEAYCSGDNMPEMAKELFNADFENSREIFEEYENKHSKAEKTIAKMHEFNVYGVSNLVNLYNPDKVVLGGALPLNHPELMIEPLQDEVGQESVNNTPEISLCDLEEESVIHGLKVVCNKE